MSRLEEIRKRAEAATEGPWQNVRPGGIPPGIVCDIKGKPWDITDDAEFISHARSDIPWLLALLAQKDEALRYYELPDGHFWDCKNLTIKPDKNCDPHCKDARAALAAGQEDE